MGKKLAILAAAGAGYYFAKREMKNNPDGSFAKAIRTIIDNPTVSHATDKTKAKVGETVRKQGEAVTDKVADAVKQRLFGTDIKSEKPEYVDVEVEEVIVEPPQRP
ncbi:MAG: YtxH domain-containing protein [Actinomycetaceae bacterium]|nr:YtxH domain-containing protein [Actinomycetaceae bacterium]